MSKKVKYITISLDEETTAKATKRAEEERRPLAQLLGLILADSFNPSPRAEICENLNIYRDGAKVNELNATGTPAALELAKILIWHYNDPRSVKIAGFINSQGVQNIRAVYCFPGAGSSYKYEYLFTGQACENLPRI